MIVDKSEDAFAPAPDALATLKERLGTERNGEVDEQTREEIFRAVCRLATHNPRNMCIRKEVDDEIIRGANDQLLRRMSGDLLTETREALANYSQGVNAFAAVARAGEALMGPELVHNSYFDCPAVVELIGRHMVEEDFLGLAEEPRSVPVSPETREWMAAFRGLADGETACFETRHRGTEMALPRLGEPNRWAMGTLFFWILPFATPLFITTGLAATSSTMAVNEIFHLGLLVWGGLLMFPGWIVTLPMACVARNRARNGARRGAIAEVMFATTLLWTILWCLGLLLILLGPHLYNFVVVELLGKG
jgi:hypothetical protein